MGPFIGTQCIGATVKSSEVFFIFEPSAHTYANSILQYHTNDLDSYHQGRQEYAYGEGIIQSYGSLQRDNVRD